MNFKNWLLIERIATKLYHGTTTGPNNEKLLSFMNQGVQPHSSQGFGQGSGFYVWTNFDAAANHALSLTQKNENLITGQDSVTKSKHGGQPMVVVINDVLNPKDYDFDLEFTPKSLIGFIMANQETINRVLPLKNVMGTHQKTQQPIRIVKVEVIKGTPELNPSIKLIYNDNAYGSYNVGGGYANHAKELQTFSQSLFQNSTLETAYKQFVRSHQKGISGKNTEQAVKYIGKEPKMPSEILVHNGQQWIPAKQYLVTS